MSEGNSNSLVSFSGKPIEKLIDVISKGIGVLYEPTKIKRLAKAESFRIGELAKANKLAEHAGIEADEAFYERMESRMLVREINKQVNIEQISQKATEILQLEDSVSEEPVDEDWINRFFRHAEDIGREDMQLLWAKILAGEVKQPNSFSLRTLDFLRNISKSEAESIMHLFKYVLDNGKVFFAYRGGQTFRESCGMNLNFILLMKELGIIQNTDDISQELPRLDKDYIYHYFSKDKVLFINKGANTQGLSIPVYPLTKLGQEIYKISEIDSDFEVFKQMPLLVNSDKINFEYAKILDIKKSDSKNKVIEYETPLVKL